MHLDDAARERLALLRERDSIGLYAGDDPTDGRDGGRALLVTIDPTTRVVDVRVTDVERVSTPEELRAAFRAAYLDALHHRIADGDVPRVRRRPRAEFTPLTARRPEEVLVERRQRPAARATTRRAAWGPVTGTSVNGCVSVTLPPARSVGDLVADAEWLSNARAGQVGGAVLEAFDDAYTRRTS